MTSQGKLTLSQEKKRKPQVQKLSSAAIKKKFQQGVALHQKGILPEAEKIFTDILRCEPTHLNALLLLGLIALQTNRAQLAVKMISRAVACNPNIAAARNNLGSALLALGRFDEALANYEVAVALKPDHASAHNNRGNALNAMGRYEEALQSFDKAIALNPNFVEAHYNRGAALNYLKRHTEALASCDKVIDLKRDYAAAHNNRGNALNGLKRYQEALAAYEQAIYLRPDFAEAHYNRGAVLDQLQRREEALASYDTATKLNPILPNTHYNRGLVLNYFKRHEEALASFDRAIELSADFAEAHNSRGNTLNALNRLEEALLSYDRAIALKPDLAEAYNNRGVILNAFRRYAEALESYDKAITLKPGLASTYNNRAVTLNAMKRHLDALASCHKAIELKINYADAHSNRALVLNDLKRHEAAARAYADVLKIDPEHLFTKGRYLHQKMLSCDWTGTDELVAEIHGDIESGKLSAEPFGWQGATNSKRSLRLCAELYSRSQFPAAIKTRHQSVVVKHKKIRVGYLSADLREHPTSHLISGVLELHNNSRFEIYAFDNGWDDKSEIRQRIEMSLHSIIDISQLSDSSAVAAIRKNQIEILVNLNGYFGEHRTQVFAQRAAPIQVNYLGFPGTMGAPYMDYIIADQHVIPPDHKQFYSEKVVYLPDCYQANDRTKKIGAKTIGRTEWGLPQSGFVFCCFNNNYKITSSMFDCWMRILKRVHGSVLWLLEDNASAASNLRGEATARNINPERLVFAKRIPLSDHLARHRLADLFLDTLPCNAHTTASDALWAGLPVLTQIGETFTGRVAASLLNAIGLTELITQTPKAYEALAVELATQPQKLAYIKQKLTNNRLTTPLFDTKRYARNIEAAYAAMFQRYQAGLPPDHITISKVSNRLQ